MSEIDRAFAPIYRLVAAAGARQITGRAVPTAAGANRMGDGLAHSWLHHQSDECPTIAELTGEQLDEVTRRRLLKDYDSDVDDDGVPYTDADLISDRYWNEHYPDLLREASAYYTTPEMSSVIDHAGHYLPDTFLLLAEHIPAQLGVVVVGDPIVDDWSRTDAIYWHLFPTGVVVALCGTSNIDRYPRATTLTLPFRRNVLHLFDPDDGSTLQTLRWLFAFWLFIAQQLPALEKRWARRQLRRHDLADAPTLHTTTFVTLRRRATRPGDPEPADTVAWSHRWLVSGHWRDQYYPSSDEHHTIWIAPYVKGPDDLPLVPKDRAFVVSR